MWINCLRALWGCKATSSRADSKLSWTFGNEKYGTSIVVFLFLYFSGMQISEWSTWPKKVELWLHHLESPAMVAASQDGELVGNVFWTHWSLRQAWYILTEGTDRSVSCKCRAHQGSALFPSSTFARSCERSSQCRGLAVQWNRTCILMWQITYMPYFAMARLSVRCWFSLEWRTCSRKQENRHSLRFRNPKDI